MRRIVCVTVVLMVSLSVLLALGPVSNRARALSPRGPILVVGNGNFTAANGVVGGDGTPANPYVLEGWEIDASTAHGIEIRDATASFAIRNVSVHSGGTSHYGIYLFNVSHGLVDNATAFANWFGLLLDQSDEVTISRSNLSANLQTGLNLRVSSDVTVTENEVASNGAMGILLYQVTGATVANNTVSSNEGSGIATDVSVDVVIVDNVLTSNRDTGVDVKDSPNAEVRRNTFTSDGLFVFDSFMPADVSSYTITPDNVANGRPIRYYKDCSGLDLDGIVAAQIIIGNCTNVRIANTVMDDTDVGVEVLFSSGVAIEGNRVTDGLFGMWIMLSPNVTVAGNNLSSNRMIGLVFFGVLNGDVRNNVVGFSETGVDARFVSNLTFSENNVTGNGVGMILAQVTGARVFHNNLLRNTVQAQDGAGAANAWDDGYPSGGNYWSDFAGVDQCSGVLQDVCPDPDGIGDTPYVIDADSQDQYPLSAPHTLNTPPVASFTVSPRSGTVATTFSVDASASSDAEDPPQALRVRWDWEGDGTWDTPLGTMKTAEHQYVQPGPYAIRLEVLDTRGLANTTSVPLTVSAVDSTAPAIQHTPPEPATVGQPITVEATVMDAGGLKAVALFYRGVADTSEQSLPMVSSGGGVYRATVPAQSRPGTLTYHIEATDVSDNVGRSPAIGDHTVVIRGAASPFPLEIVLYAIPLAAVAVALILLLRRRRKRPSVDQGPRT